MHLTSGITKLKQQEYHVYNRYESSHVWHPSEDRLRRLHTVQIQIREFRGQLSNQHVQRQLENRREECRRRTRLAFAENKKLWWRKPRKTNFHRNRNIMSYPHFTIPRICVNILIATDGRKKDQDSAVPGTKSNCQSFHHHPMLSRISINGYPFLTSSESTLPFIGVTWHWKRSNTARIQPDGHNTGQDVPSHW